MNILPLSLLPRLVFAPIAFIFSNINFKVPGRSTLNPLQIREVRMTILLSAIISNSV